MGLVPAAVFILALISTEASSAPDKFHTEAGGFVPSNLRYYNEPLRTNNVSELQPSASTSKIQSKLDKSSSLQRFGMSGYGNTGAGAYPHSGNGVSAYQPVKIDIGGVVLGTIIGLGAILILPKLAHIFAGGYRRSIETEMETITDFLQKIDKSLEKYNIDSSACLHRIVCSYVQESEKEMLLEEASTMGSLIHTVTNNTLVSFLIEGTAIEEAIRLGKTKGPGDSCAPLYAKCPIEESNIMQIVSNLLPA